MNKYIENDYQRNTAEKVIIGKLLDSGATETVSGLIVKAGFLPNVKVDTLKGDFIYHFTFTDMAGVDHTTTAEANEEKEKLTKIKVGYEIIMNNLAEFAVKIHTPYETFNSLLINIPKEEILLAEYPWKEFMNFVDNKLNIVENNIKLGQNDNINELLK